MKGTPIKHSECDKFAKSYLQEMVGLYYKGYKPQPEEKLAMQASLSGACPNLKERTKALEKIQRAADMLSKVVEDNVKSVASHPWTE